MERRRHGGVEKRRRCRGGDGEIRQRKCRGGAKVVQRCRCRCAQLKVQTKELQMCGRDTDAVVQSEVQRCRIAEGQRGIGAEAQS